MYLYFLNRNKVTIAITITQIPTLPQLTLTSANVKTTIGQCYVNVVATTLPIVRDQCWDNVQADVAWRLWQHRFQLIGTSVETMCYANVVSMLVLNVRDQHWDNIEAKLCECCINIGAEHCSYLFQVQIDSYIQIWIFNTFATSILPTTATESG